jgi:hypothetical protein
MLGICVRSIYELLAQKEIRAVKAGKRNLVIIASLHEYVDKLKPAKIKPITRRNGKKQEHRDDPENRP